jgi:uncharacterized membrane protein YqjE
MTSKGMLIFRDVTYSILVILLLWPSNPLGITPLFKILLIAIAVGVRVWQHVNYYKQTGKIY